jgi:phosphate butyryltransferase
MIKRVEDILTLAKGRPDRPRVVVVGSENDASLETVCAAHAEGLSVATLIGDRDKTLQIAEENSLDLSPFELIDAKDPDEVLEKSFRAMADGGDFLMKGQFSTGLMMKKVLEKQYGFRTDRILSYCGAFNAPGENRLMLLTDAGINISPDMARKVDIVKNAVDMAHALGIECPKVAMLAFVEKADDPRIKATLDAALIAKMSQQGEIPGCIVDGPFALDNAVSPEAARIKKIGGPVAGQADILVTHDINMGNAIYKALQVWQQALIAGTVLGTKIPIVLTSRADSMPTKLHSIALAILLTKVNR